MKRTGLCLFIISALLISGLLIACVTPAETPPEPVVAPTSVPVAETETVIQEELPLPDDPLNEHAETVTLLDESYLQLYKAGNSILCVAPVDMQTIAEKLLACKALQRVDARMSGLDHAAISELRALLPGISVVETVEVNGESFDSDVKELTLSSGSMQEAAETLDLFPALEQVSLSAPALTADEYRAFSARFPNVALTCGILISETVAPIDCTELDLSGLADFDPTDLALFPALRSLELDETSPIAVRDLKRAYPDLTIVSLFRGKTVSKETTELDLRNAPVPTAEELNAILELAPQLETLLIAKPDEEALKELLAFHPRDNGIDIQFTVTVLGEEFSTGTEIMDFGNRKITDEEAAEIERILPVMTHLNEVDMYDAKLSQETMDRLFDTYPDIFFGWTFGIWNDYYIVRSDATAFTSGTGQPGFHNGLLTEDDYRNLRYCKGLLALDLGHNGIKNIEFLRNWPHLRVLILADTRVTDLSVLAELQDLQYIELFLTTPDSYEPLTHLPNLLDLNLGHTKKAGKKFRDDDEIRLLTQIKSLERLWINKTLTPEQAQILREGLPGVEFDFSSYGSTDKGWRKHPRYFIMRRGFQERHFYPFE